MRAAAAAVAILGMSLFTSVAVAQTPSVTTVGALGARGVGITLGPDGALWHTTRTTVGSTTVAGRTTTYSAGTGADAGAITAGPDGALWFVRRKDGIGRVTPAGTLTSFNGLQAEPHALVTGVDGNLWFSAKDKRPGFDDDAVGRITPAGAVTIFGVGITGEPLDIASGPDGALWFTEPEVGRVGRITTAGQLSEVAVGGEPTGIAAGPDGALWFTDRSGAVGRVATNGTVARYGGAGEHPGDIAAGSDGALWYTLEHGLGRITTAGAVTTWDLGRSKPVALAAGPDAALYFTDGDANALGRIDSRSAVALAPPLPPVARSQPSASPPEAKLGKTVVVAPVRGRVRVRAPGGRFEALRADTGVPVGSLVDTTDGTVSLRSATRTGEQVGVFHGGRFTVRQRRSGHVDLHLRGALGCSRATQARAAGRRPDRRKIWGRDSGGSYSTHGRDSVTTVRGTKWLTMDTCRGTLTRVKQGSVTVRDKHTGKRRVVRAGHQHFVSRR